jgi:hypothetical protein
MLGAEHTVNELIPDPCRISMGLSNLALDICLCFIDGHSERLRRPQPGEAMLRRRRSLSSPAATPPLEFGVDLEMVNWLEGGNPSGKGRVSHPVLEPKEEESPRRN